MGRNGCIRSLCMFLLLAVSAGTRLCADVTGTILGTVVDPTGAVIVAANVTLRNHSTGLVRTTTTDASGSYQFLQVPISEDYVVEVEAAGFQKSIQSGLKLLVNQVFRADVALQVGPTTQSVEVSAAPVQVETTTTQLGDVIEDKKMTALPLNGRSYIDLLGLQAGVVPITSGAAPTGVASGNSFGGQLSVNGSREAANAFLVNGGDVEEGWANGASILPSLDSIQEFRLLTSSFDAEYGRFSGAVVNVITKGGNNEFHGDLYEFLRNEKLDARNFFEYDQVDPTTGRELPGTARGEFRRNQFGFTAGGPIRKNRLFFFTDYQGTREVRGASSGVIRVPSLLERNGDFSDVGSTGFPALTGTVRGDNIPGNGSMDETLSRRLGYPVTSGEPYWIPGCNTLADAQVGMCVFPGQAIPQSAWSPAAKGTLKFIPLPSGTSAGAPFFLTSAYKGSVRDDKFGNRIDVNTQAAGNWGFYYNFDDATVLNPYGGGNVPGFPGVTGTRAQQANLNNARNFGPSAVNEWRLNFTRYAIRPGPAGAGLGKVSNFGFVEGGLGIIPPVASDEGVPNISLALTGVSFGLPASPWQFNNTYQAGDNFSKIVGRHSLKFGGESRYFQINEFSTYVNNGNFSFSGSETGNDFADFLLGAPDQFIMGTPGILGGRTKYGAVYGQDSYKVRRNITINAGLRWEVTQPWYDTKNRLQAFVPGLQSKRYPDSPLGWVFAGDPGIPRGLAPTRWDKFAPRLGIAYSPGFSSGIVGKLFGGPGKTSIRAATGIYYTAFEQVINNWELGNSPFAQYYISAPLIYLEEPFKSRRGTDPGQRFPFVNYPDGSTGFWAQFQPIGSQTSFKLDNVVPYTEHFNFTLQREFQRSIIVTLGYVGTRGHHLISSVTMNPGSPARCLQVAAILTGQGNAGGACGPFGEDTIYNLGNGQFAYGTRPYSVTSGRLLNKSLLDFTTNQQIITGANSNYNALQASVEKRVGNLRLLAAYTLSKSLDDYSGFNDNWFNPYNNHLAKALSSFDMTHNFVASYSYDIPFQRLVHSSSGAALKVFQGWQLSGITHFATGFPVPIMESGDRSLCGCPGADFPNYNGQPIQFFNPRTSANHLYFSTVQFSSPDLGVQGTANRKFFHGPGLNNWDFALHKTTHVTERSSVEFRAEFFNTFNHAQFVTPTGDFASSSFAQVTAARDPRIGQLALKLYF